MTIIDIAAALEEGSLPTNEQLLAVLSKVEASSALSPSKLSPAGTSLAGDIKGVFTTLKDIIKERNGDEELQTFLWRTRLTYLKAQEEGVTVQSGKAAKLEAEGIKKEKKTKRKQLTTAVKRTKSESSQAFAHLRTILRLVLVQPELRHIVADLGFLAAEVVEGTVSETMPFAQNDLGQVRNLTGNYQLTGKENLGEFRKAFKAGELDHDSPLAAPTNGDAQPLLASRTSQAVNEAVSQVASKLNGSANGSVPAAEPSSVSANDASEGLQSSTVIDSTQKALLSDAATLVKDPIKFSELLRDPAKAKALVKDGEVLKTLQGIASQPIISSKGKDGAQIAIADLADVAQMAAVGDLAGFKKKTEILAHAKERSKINAKEAWNAERKTKLVARLRKLCVDCQKNTEYQDALLWFIDRVKLVVVTAQAHVEAPTSSLDSALSFAAEPLLKLIENFAEGHSFKSILELARKLSIGAKEDPEIRQWWIDAEAFVRRALLKEGYALRPECEKDAEDLLHRFRAMNEVYKRTLVSLVQEAASFAKAITEDPLLNKLTVTSKDLVKDIVVGKDGKWFQNKDLIRDIRVVLLPTLFAKMGVLPIPRITYTHPEFDVVVENIAIELRQLLPSIFDVKMTNDVHIDFEHIHSSSHAHSLKVKIKGMTLRIHKLAFAFKSKFGIIPFTDKGIADLLIGDFGVTMYIDVPKNPGVNIFVVKKVKAKLKTLRVRVRKSNHYIMHKIAEGLVNSYLAKRILRHFTAMGIAMGLKQLNLQLVAIKLGQTEKSNTTAREDVERRLAELRDLLKKYRESAGELDIEFTREDDPEGKKRWEDAHAVKWAKKQITETAAKEIIRNEWRSNVFDLAGMASISAAVPDDEELKTLAAADEDGDELPTETAAEADAQGKLEPTTERTVEQAQRDLEVAEAREQKRSDEAQDPSKMESKEGAEAVKQTDSTTKQIKHLEDALDSP